MSKSLVQKRPATKAGEANIDPVLLMAALREKKVDEERQQYNERSKAIWQIYRYDCMHYSETLGYQGDDVYLLKWSEGDGFFLDQKVEQIDGLKHWARAEELFEEGILTDQTCENGARQAYFTWLHNNFS